MQSYHKPLFENYMKQKAELAELRHKSCYKRGRDKESSGSGSNLTQPKLSLCGGGSGVQV